MSDYELLSEEDKDYLEMLANNLITNAEYCEVYESPQFCDRDDGVWEQAHDYLAREITASRDDK